MASKTEQKLEYLKGTKDAIKNAIVAKGQAVTDTDTFRSYADKIAAISGGGSADLVYVTFMSHDGAKELHKRAVVKGNTCMCPVTGAIKEIDVPTKDSTAVYRYIFGGWSTTPNGALNESALEAITADKTVYAYFTAVTRFYTINFYDGDTLLKTESVAYGITPSYTPQKDGYAFKGWSPALSPVTGDATYTAIFEELIAFAAASWEDIAEISESGQASMNFSVGDTKMFTWGGNEYKAVVLGFDQDELYDGSGNAGMTIGVMTANPTKTMLNTQYAGVSKYTGWDATQGQKQIETFLRESDLSDIVAVAKNVRKYSYRGDGNEYSAGETFFAFSLRELGLTSKATKHEPYPYFTSNETRKVMQAGTETYVKYWVRDSLCTSETANNYGSWNIIGEYGEGNPSNSGAYSHLVFGFCI